MVGLDELDVGGRRLPLSHPRYRVIPRASDKLVVFFSGTGPGDHQFQWFKVAQTVDASIMLVNNGRNEWYQHGIDGLGVTWREAAAAIRTWADALGARDIYMIGASMGGAAAMMYGAEIGARVLALASETRLDFPWSNVRRLRVKDTEPVDVDLAPLVARATQPIFLFTGETEAVDLMSAKRISDLPMVTAVAVQGIGHDVAAHFHRSGVLATVIDSLLAHSPMPQLVDEGRGLEGDFSSLQYDAFCASMEKRWPDAEHSARLAVSQYPEAVLAQTLLGKALLAQKRAQEAREPLHAATLLAPEDLDVLHFYASALERSGLRREGFEINQSILETHPEFAKSHYAVALTHLALKRREKALVSLCRAVAAAPRNSQYRAKLTEFLTPSGKRRVSKVLETPAGQPRFPSIAFFRRRLAILTRRLGLRKGGKPTT